MSSHRRKPVPRVVLVGILRHNFDRLAFRAVPTSVPSTLGYLMDDYVAHLEHHLAQVRALLA